MKINSDRVGDGVGGGPGGVSVGVFVAVGVGVRVGVFEGNMGVTEGVNVGPNVLSGGLVGGSDVARGVQVGCRRLGVAEGTGVGTAAIGTSVGISSTLMVGSAFLEGNKSANGVFCTKPGFNKTMIMTIMANKASVKNMAVNILNMRPKQPPD